MKIAIHLLVAVAVIIGVFSANAGFRWGPTAGANFYNFHFKQKLIESDMTPGPQVGVMGEIMIPGIGFGVDFGLRYNMHGAKLHLGEKEVWASDGYGTEQCWLHTLQIPLNLRFKYTRFGGFEDYLAPFVYGGPVFSFTVGHNNLKALEYPTGCFGLQCGIGAEIMKHFQISGGYYWGLTYEIRTRKLDNFSARSQGCTVNLTYLF